MIHRVYSVFDEKAAVYMLPFFAKSHEVALRSFATAALDPEHDFGRWGGDFTLFHIAEFDDDTGELKPRDAFMNLGTGLHVRAMYDKE